MRLKSDSSASCLHPASTVGRTQPVHVSYYSPTTVLSQSSYSPPTVLLQAYLFAAHASTERNHANRCVFLVRLQRIQAQNEGTWRSTSMMERENKKVLCAESKSWVCSRDRFLEAPSRSLLKVQGHRG